MAELVDAPQLDGVYPIFLTNLQHRLAIVVGGGVVGERKVAGLLAAQATVRLISPQVTPTLRGAAAAGRLEWIPRAFQTGDLEGAYLVFAATDVRETNAKVAHEASRLGALCNVADAPDEGNFHVPALHRQGAFLVAVGSRWGRNPKRVKLLRDRIAQFLTLAAWNSNA